MLAIVLVGNSVGGLIISRTGLHGKNSGRILFYLLLSTSQSSSEYQKIRAKQLLVNRAYAESVSALEIIVADSKTSGRNYYAQLMLVVRALDGESFDRPIIDTNPFIEADQEFKRWFLRKFEAVVNDK